MPRTNLHTNPCCGVAATGWTVGANGTGTRVTGLTGYLRTTGFRNTVNSTAYTSSGTPKLTATAGQVWAVQVQVTCSVSRSTTVFFNFQDGANAFLSPNPSTVITATSTPQVVTFAGTTAPTNTATVGVTVESSAGTAGDLFTVTAADFELIAAIPFYGDGDTLGWAWSGTAGSSTSLEQILPGQFMPDVRPFTAMTRASSF